MWKASFPQCFTMYLLAQIRPASRASDDSCSYSSDTKCTHSGNSSTRALFRPRSNILIFASVSSYYYFKPNLCKTKTVKRRALTRHTPAETRLWVWFILAVAVAEIQKHNRFSCGFFPPTGDPKVYCDCNNEHMRFKSYDFGQCTIDRLRVDTMSAVKEPCRMVTVQGPLRMRQGTGCCFICCYATLLACHVL